MVTPVETRTYLIWLEDDGIVRVTAKPHVTITLEDAKVCVRTIREVCGGKLTPSLVDITGIVEIDREARLYFAGEETAKVEAAAALLINSPVARAIGNFFMGLNKPILPTRLFTSEAEAL